MNSLLLAFLVFGLLLAWEKNDEAGGNRIALIVAAAPLLSLAALLANGRTRLKSDVSVFN